MSFDPFDLTGGPFLKLYLVLLAATICAGWLIPRWLRPEGRQGRSPDTGQLAFMAGGAARFADAVVARLLAARALVMTGKSGFHVQARDAGKSAAERSVLALHGEVGWREIERTLRAQAGPVERELVAAGLIMDAGLTLQMRLWQTSPYFLLLAFGAIKWLVGEARHRPVGFLAALLVVTMILAVVRWCTVDRRTRGGLAAVEAARAGAERLRRAPTVSETGIAVALFGTAVLAGSGWSGFHRLRSGPGDGGSGGCGSSGGDGGGGCGGGGCGGCGS